jgi:LmbE family N-acetylglucosaminyl deacetylase
MNIIAIGAHLDDIELACGGTIAKAVKAGHNVKMVVLSESSYFSYDGKLLRTKEQARLEGENAAKELGVKQLEILDFKSTAIPYSGESVTALDLILNQFQPDLILTHSPFDTHQDHNNTSKATISAARNFNNILMYEPFPPSGRSYVAFKPQVYIDITDTIDVKINSMKEHKSQHEKYGEDWVEAIRGRARMRGFECNYKYAEVFEALRFEIKF